MDNTWQDLRKELIKVLGSDEVYFQPPPNVKMCYPAIKFKLSDIHTIYADNKLYNGRNRYEVILIHTNANNDIYCKMIELEYARFTRYYVSDNLNHYVFNIYF